MEYSSTFITGAANTVSHGVVWIPEHFLFRSSSDNSDSSSAREGEKRRNLVAYALSNSIAVVDDRSTRVLCTLRSPLLSQEDNLTALACVCDERNDRVCLVSGSEKGVVSLWTLPRITAVAAAAAEEEEEEQLLCEWTLTQSLTDLRASIATLSALSVPGSREVLLFASDAGGHCALYQSLSAEPTLRRTQEMRFPPQQLPNTSHLISLSQNTLCLALGGVDAKLHLFVATLTHTDSEAERCIHFSSAGSLSGHEEWLTCIASLSLSPSETFLASASQDNKIRIWKIVRAGAAATALAVEREKERERATEALTLAAQEQHENEDEEDEEEEDAEEAEGGNNKGASAVPVPLEDERALSTEARLQFLSPRARDGLTETETAKEEKEEERELFEVFLESLLIGHEDWVTSVHWMPYSPSSSAPVQLFSTSMDRNMVIWSPDPSAGGVWEPVVRVGDIGGALGGAIGGNLLGFVGGAVSPQGDALLGIGYGGSFHYWQRGEEQRWSPRPFLTGHFDAVSDIAWEESQGLYFVSVSHDQTCRVFSSLASARSPTQRALWKEISRPEIHGYSLNAVVLSPNSYEMLTAGEEKLIRGFDAPQLVLRGFKELCGMQLPYAPAVKVEQAYIPELGLSNKGKELMTNQEIQEQEARGVAAISWTLPPLESQLSDHTLWLETHKMFGHNNEVVCMARSRCGQWLASSSKARYSHSCFVLLWSLETHSLVDKLPGHESTASCMEFSPDGRFLASSGKDRSICVYSRLEDPTTGDLHYTPVLCFKNAHKRIVWDLSWTGDGKYLVTSSRDGSCKVWKVLSNEDGSSVQLETAHQFTPFAGAAVTAVDIEKLSVDGEHWRMVLGCESGAVQQWTVNVNTGEPARTLEVPSNYAHSKAVKRLVCKPSKRPSAQVFEWASCAEDNTVRVHRTFIK